MRNRTEQNTLLPALILAVASLLASPVVSATTLSEIQGFENASSWSGVSGLSNLAVQGSSSAIIDSNSWSEVVSVPLSSAGIVEDTAYLNVRMAAAAQYWGEIRLRFTCPSKGIWSREIGPQSLVGKAPGVFHTLAFSVPSDLRQLLNSTGYSDLTITVIINAPAGQYLLDNLLLGAQSFDDTDTFPDSADTDSDNDTSSEENTLIFSIPEGNSLQDTVLGASRNLVIRNSVQVVAESGSEFGMIGTTGSTTVEIHASAAVGTVYSNGDVWMMSNSSVYGDILAARHHEPQAGVYFEGEEKLEGHVIDDMSWRFDVPETTKAGVFLSSTQYLDGPLLPGRYESLRLHPRTSVTLTAGSYVFNQFQIDTDAEIILDDSEGPIFIYVIAEDNYFMRGKLAPVDGEYARAMFAYTGSRDVFIETRMVGTVVAPNAKVVVRASSVPHEGAIFAKDIEIDAGAVIYHRSFGWFVSEIVVSNEEPCLGESTTIWVDTFDNWTDESLDIHIDGSWGDYRMESFYGSAFEREVTATVSTGAGNVEISTAIIRPRECDLKVFPVISAVWDPMVQKHRVSVLNPYNFSPGAVYHWILGDGHQLTTDRPVFYHDYSNDIEHGSLFTTFEIYVEVEEAGVVTATGATTLKIMSDFAFDKRHGILRPLSRTQLTNLPMSKETHYLSYNLSNPDPDDSALFSAVMYEFIPCATSAVSVWKQESASVTVGPLSSAAGTFQLSENDIPENTCYISMRLVGQSSAGLMAYADFTYRLENDARPQTPVYDEDARAFILEAIKKGWGREIWRISLDELMEWKTRGVDVPDSLLKDVGGDHRVAAAVSREMNGGSPAPYLPSVADPAAEVEFAKNLSGFREVLAAMTLAQEEALQRFSDDPIGDQCEPGQGRAIWNGQEYLCTPDINSAGEIDITEEESTYIANARKGDALLSRECSFIGDMLTVLDHQYSHTGIMTQHGTEVTHSTLEVSRLLDNLNGIGLKGIDSAVLKYGFPGIITQSIDEAYFPIARNDCDSLGGSWQSCNCETDHTGDPTPEKGYFPDCYNSTSFNINDVACSGTDSVKPLVVKPVPEFDETVRSRLMAAANYAKTVRGHYRFNTYLKGDIFNDSSKFAPELSKWPAGEGSRPSSCAVFVMNALNSADFNLNYQRIKNNKVKQMVKILHSGIRDKGLAKLGSMPDFFAEGWAGQVAPVAVLTSGLPIVAPVTETLLAIFGGTFGTALLVKRGAEHAANQIANCFVSDNCSDSYDNRTSEAWETPEDAITLSPGHLIDDLFPSAAEGGPYGHFERPVFVRQYYSVPHSWQPATTPIDIQITVRDECGDPIKDAEVTLLDAVDADGNSLTGMTDATGVHLFEDVLLGASREIDILQRGVEVLVEYKSVVRKESVVLVESTRTIDGTVPLSTVETELDLEKFIPQAHKFTFAGIMQMFEDGPGDNGNDKKQKSFIIELTLSPGDQDKTDYKEYCLKDAQATIRLTCSLDGGDNDDVSSANYNPVDNGARCKVYSAIEQGTSCNNLNDKDSFWTPIIFSNAGDIHYVSETQRLDGARDDRMTYKGWIVHDFAWDEEYSSSTTGAGSNLVVSIKQELDDNDGGDHSTEDDSVENEKLVTWSSRVAENAVWKCLNNEMVGETIAVAVLEPGDYPLLQDGGDIDWDKVVKGSTNNVRTVMVAQGFEDNSCDQGDPFDGFFSTFDEKIVPGGSGYLSSGKMWNVNALAEDDWMRSSVTVENRMDPPVVGGGRCE